MRIPALITSLVVLLSATFVSAKPVPINGFAAKVNGKVITKYELTESIKIRKMMISRIPDPSERAKKLKTVRPDMLEMLIERELALSEFDKRGGQVKPEMVDDNINKIIREQFDGDRATFVDELKKQGMTNEKFRKEQEKAIAINYMRNSAISEIPVVTPTEIKKYYDNNPLRFRAEGFIRLRTMTISRNGDDGDVDGQTKLVAEIHKKLINGADFATLAKTYSIDSAAPNGGDRGTIGRDTEELRKDLVDLAFAQPTGKVSKIFPDKAFYYILKVESRKPGKRAPLTDTKVREAITAELKRDKREASQDRWVERLKKTAIIKRY
ncbi:MAG: peptidyl-prolyl cis-trans isomerase SurA [Verrucomicrobiales bacterium]|jgi:peptidyl-prolyl cis-trans isomerase SurA